MGTLTSHLQQRFAELCPAGWSCRQEVAVLPPDLDELLGYSSRADVLLEHQDSGRKLWIEFEVSRADPVANHAKFATSHLFRPIPSGSAFVSMVSSHVERGRRNLAAATVHLMRHVGIESFQTLLLPHCPPPEIKRLNHLAHLEIAQCPLRVDQEIERAIAISQPLFATGSVRVHLCGDLLDVLLGLRRWNKDIDTDDGKRQWGKRTVTYFVVDPVSGQFAPSKFCAYLPVITSGWTAGEIADREMSISAYSRIESSERRFDGGVAWNHLSRNLAMTVLTAQDDPSIAERFGAWLEHRTDAINLHPKGPVFLMFPKWFY